MGTHADHEPLPVAGTEHMPITLCVVCTEKLRRTVDGEWEHFGVGGSYEPFVIGPVDGAG